MQPFERESAPARKPRGGGFARKVRIGAGQLHAPKNRRHAARAKAPGQGRQEISSQPVPVVSRVEVRGVFAEGNAMLTSIGFQVHSPYVEQWSNQHAARVGWGRHAPLHSAQAFAAGATQKTEEEQ